MKGDNTMSHLNNGEALDGVKCVVQSCVYNKEGRECTAKSILVEPKNANTSDDTDCSTFRPLS